MVCWNVNFVVSLSAVFSMWVGLSSTNINTMKVKSLKDFLLEIVCSWLEFKHPVLGYISDLWSTCVNCIV